MGAVNIDFATKNLTIDEIATRLQCSYNVAYKALRKHQLPYKSNKYGNSGKYKLSPEQQQFVCQLYLEGKSITEISNMFPDTNRITIFNVLKRHHIRTRLRNGLDALKPPKVSKEELEYWYWDKNQSLWEIAERFEYPNAMAVSREFKQYGIARRDYVAAGKAKYASSPTHRAKVLSGFERVRKQWYLGKKTWIEQWCADWLHAHHITYKYQYQLPEDISSLTHYFDFFLPEFNLLIEMDGVYWHRRAKQKQRDNFFDAAARECGFNVIRITDDECKMKGMRIFNEKLDEYVERRTDGVCANASTGDYDT